MEEMINAHRLATNLVSMTLCLDFFCKEALLAFSKLVKEIYQF